MTRPLDWAPLAAHDPVPGDPDEVEWTAKQHADLAEELRTQAADLRTLSSAQGWDADAGRVFAASANDVVGQLDKARRRYATSADALRSYAPELRYAQSEADAALVQARAAQEAIDANQPQPSSNSSSSSSSSSSSGAAPSPPTAQEMAVQRRRADALDEGLADLQRARRRLNDALDHRDRAGARAAAQIRDVVDHDGLGDSWWDHFSNWVGHGWDHFIDWVHEHAKDIKALADLCGVIATVLGVIAIVISFIPVLDFLTPVLLGAAAVLTAVSLICHTMLALSGDGSWVDVGLDVFALVTFGYGKVASASLKGAQVALRTAGTRALRSAARSALRGGALRSQIQEAASVLADRSASAAAKRGAQAALRVLDRQATRQASQTARGLISATEDLKLPALKAISFLDGEVAGARASAEGIVRLASNSAGVARLGQDVVSLTNNMRLAAGAATVIDLADKSTSFDIPFTDVHVDLTGPLPDKPSLFEPLKPLLVFGRYAGG